MSLSPDSANYTIQTGRELLPTRGVSQVPRPGRVQPSGLGFLLERCKKPEATGLARRAQTVPLPAAATTSPSHPGGPRGHQGQPPHPQSPAPFSPDQGWGAPHPPAPPALEAETLETQDNPAAATWPSAPAPGGRAPPSNPAPPD